MLLAKSLNRKRFRDLVIALGFEPAVYLCEPVSPAPLDGLPLADSTHTHLRLCAPSTVGSAAGMTAAALSTIRRPRLGTVSARAGGEGGQDEGGGCEGKGERGGEGRVSVTIRLGGRCGYSKFAASRDPTGLRCQE